MEEKSIFSKAKISHPITTQCVVFERIQCCR